MSKVNIERGSDGLFSASYEVPAVGRQVVDRDACLGTLVNRIGDQYPALQCVAGAGLTAAEHARVMEGRAQFSVELFSDANSLQAGMPAATLGGLRDKEEAMRNAQRALQVFGLARVSQPDGGWERTFAHDPAEAARVGAEHSPRARGPRP